MKRLRLAADLPNVDLRELKVSRECSAWLISISLSRNDIENIPKDDLEADSYACWEAKTVQKHLSLRTQPFNTIVSTSYRQLHNLDQ